MAWTLRLLLAASALLIAMPAAAAAGPGCKDGAYCLWTKANYKGEKLVVETNKLFKFPGSMNNKATSFKSRVGNNDATVLYTGNHGGSGPADCYDDGANDAAFEDGNNRFSSGDVVGVTC